MKELIKEIADTYAKSPDGSKQLSYADVEAEVDRLYSKKRAMEAEILD